MSDWAWLLLVELLLRVAGIAEPVQQEGLSRGFDHSEAYFLPVEGEPGSWQTQFWSLEEKRPIVIPPKDGRERWLLFGGSNTEGFGKRFLSDALAAAGDLERVEVINLGRSGYGSERVSIIFEQALELLEPDVMVTYSGHNEFVEAGFQKDLDVQWPSETTRILAKAALETHVFQVLRQAFAPPSTELGPRHGSAPKDWEWEYAKFAGTTYSETLAHFEAYRGNLERMVAAAEQRGVRVVLCTVIYNRLSTPSSSTPPAELAEADAASVGMLMERATALLPEALSPLFPTSDSQRVRNTDWDVGFREGLVGGPRRSATRSELHGWRRFEGVLAKTDPILPASAYWAPKVERLLTSLDTLATARPSGEQRRAAEQALDLLEQLLDLEPDHPHALFMRGILRLWLGADAELVRADLEDAGAFDRAPRRGNRVTNAIVAEVASAHPEVLFFDADRLWRERHPMQLVGWEWMLDRCHLNLGARQLLMADLCARILERWGVGS